MKQPIGRLCHHRLAAAGGLAMLLVGLVALGGCGATRGDNDAPGAEAPASASFGAPRLRCGECGVVAVLRNVPPVDTIDTPAAAITPAKAGRNKTTVSMAASYEVTVRMTDGSRRVFQDVQANTPNWRLGERMIVIGGTAPPIR